MLYTAEKLVIINHIFLLGFVHKDKQRERERESERERERKRERERFKGYIYLPADTHKNASQMYL